MNSTRINLNDNPLWCDCQSAWLAKIANTNPRIIGSCYNPEKLRDMRLSYIDVDMLNCGWFNFHHCYLNKSRVIFTSKFTRISQNIGES